MNGWRLVASLLFAFGVGWIICSWRSLIRYEHWMRRALVAEANVDHALCEVTERAMANFIAYQERELDAYRAGKDVGDEAEEYLRDGGS